MGHYEKLHVTAGGDAEGGWMVDIHDGQNSAVYSTEGGTLETAIKAALSDHAKAFPTAPGEHDFEFPAAAAPVSHANESAAPAASDANQPAETSGA